MANIFLYQNEAGISLVLTTVMMSKSKTFFLKNQKRIVLTLVIALLGFVGLFLSHSPEVRQPMNVVGGQSLSPRLLVKKNMVNAKITAERLDEETGRIIGALGMNRVQRWFRGVHLERIQQQYDRDLLWHLTAMGELFKYRRQLGGLKKLQEFEFQNLVRRSDYVLSLNVAKQSLRSLGADRQRYKDFYMVLKNYNQERELFDARRIVIAVK